MKKHTFLSVAWWLTMGCMAVVAVGAVLIAPESIAAPRANPKRGKVFYKNNCRACHDGQTADVKDLSPITKTMEQWAREFEPEGDVARCIPRVKDKVGTELTERDLLDIQSYLIQHAADSDQPATCGN